MRKKPYTARGIKRVPCSRHGCGKPGYASWNICSDGGQMRVFCAECDVGMNELAMRYAFGDTREDDLAAYRAKVLGDGKDA
jgi:hypothetical protein